LRIALLVVLALLSSAQAALAQSNVVLVNPENALLRATEKALLPWQITVTALTSEQVAPSESMPGARDRARELCSTHAARAAIWLTSNDDGEALWVYDLQSDRVVVRKLNVHRPLGDADAAAVALSIKTLLMHTSAAPPPQRFGALPIATVPSAPAPKPKQPVAASRWQAHSELLFRHGAQDGHADARLGLGLFRTFEPFRLGLVFAAGPGYSVAAPEFRGHFADASLALEARIRKTWHGLTWVGLANLALHRAQLEGTLSPGQESVVDTRYNPSLALGGALQVPVGAAHLGVGLRTRYYTRSQRYLVRSAPVLDLPSIDLEFGMFVGIPL
tara:strand:- start:1905 stop:2897 length:993 start_codon:yes stop_codon:yes gene_type:complete